MKWFRSNIRLGSRLALLALAIQFLLAFGHFHGSSTQAALASMAAKQWRLHHDHAVHFAASRADLLGRASPANTYGRVRLQTSSDHRPAGEPTDDCAICAVMALASAMVVATPPYLVGPQAAAISYLTTGTEFVALNTARVAFQPRAPPIA
jgi:hypothetical protein